MDMMLPVMTTILAPGLSLALLKGLAALRCLRLSHWARVLLRSPPQAACWCWS
jgi:hypothetical protein